MRGHYHLADRVDDQIRLVEMNPVRAFRRNHLLHVVADAAQDARAESGVDFPGVSTSTGIS